MHDGTSIPRWRVLLGLASLALFATGCPPILPAGYAPPRVDSVETSPQTVRPGETVTFVIEASDDQRVMGGGPLQFTTPGGTTLNAVGVCTVDQSPSLADNPLHAVLTVGCPVPTYANNGRWYLRFRINDGGERDDYHGTDVQLPFEVTGGTDDRQAPQLLDVSTDPAVVHPNMLFTLTLRLSDESSPLGVGDGYTQTFQFSKPFDPWSTVFCRLPTATPVSAAVVDVAFICGPGLGWVGPPAVVGEHRALVTATDALGQVGTFVVSVDLQPAPA